MCQATNIRVVDPPAGDLYAVAAVSYTNAAGIPKVLPFNTIEGLGRWLVKHGARAPVIDGECPWCGTHHQPDGRCWSDA